MPVACQRTPLESNEKSRLRYFFPLLHTKCELKLAAMEKTDLRDVTKGTGVSSQLSGNAHRLVDLQPTGPSGVEGPTKDRFQKKVNTGCQQRAKQVTSWSFIVTFANL